MVNFSRYLSFYEIYAFMRYHYIEKDQAAINLILNNVKAYVEER
jgi:hypothetical protein